MRVAMFDTHAYEREAFETANAAFGHELAFFEPRLTADTASVAAGFPAVCAFVNDRLDRPALSGLRDGGTRLVALRAAGFNHVDLGAAGEYGITVARVPAYSLLASRRRRTRGGFDIGAQPQDPSRLQPCARRQLPTRRAGGRGSRGQDRRRHRHRAHRRRVRAHHARVRLPRAGV